ncbi:hypothetical protein CL633_01905 [bacterium]|nr:hypothetical protein [bacterium]|tara:strand:- start:10858 stop:11850 length:993 start_codon:yes stop_codon:yes gene_type:complete
MIKFIIKIIIIIAIILGIGFYFLNRSEEPEQVEYGVTFSQKYAKELGLNWKETYLALLDDLQIKKLRLIAYWDKIEPENNKFDFTDLDWQIAQAEEHNAEVILAIGYKLPRWPECHIPNWVELDQKKRPNQNDLLDMVEQVVKHYKDQNAITIWQIENEPFINFGECPPVSNELLDQEIYLTKAFSQKPVMITDSGELSLWYRASERSDIFGTTLYRKVYNNWIGYISYPIPSWWYKLRAKIVRWIMRTPVIVSEMQAEPWTKHRPPNTPLEEQFKTMNPEIFQDIINYEKKTGIDIVYLWGAEWWYWMRENKEQDDMWEAVKLLMINDK